jgi:hypothetical protein
MQYTFTSDEVQPDPGGDETDFEPKDEALEALERELEGYLSENYPVTDVDAPSWVWTKSTANYSLNV